jgi:alkylation response protein AidB-like acyl-CoA dehydrogenase
VVRGTAVTADSTTRRGTAGALAAELRAWLDAHPPPALDVATTPAEAEELRAWQRTLDEAGWVGIHWPVEAGGRGAPVTEVAACNVELARAGAPPLLGRVGVSLVGPTLMVHGTEAQRARWLPRILSGDDVWCQLFSEPGAGSDLASLTTRAVRAADGWRISGQKVWSSYATFADLGIALVRTAPEAPAHRGISMVAVPMDAAGVDVRPLRQLTGAYEFNEVFLDDVAVPADHVIGALDGGWAVANTTLANERGASFIWREQVLHALAVEALVEECRARGLRTDPLVRQRLARSFLDGELFRWHNARTLARLARGEDLGAEASLTKLLWAAASQRLGETAVAVLGPDALVGPNPWATRLLATRANSIMGGTSEIQRTVIGERLLGLPREPKVAS